MLIVTVQDLKASNVAVPPASNNAAVAVPEPESVATKVVLPQPLGAAALRLLNENVGSTSCTESPIAMGTFSAYVNVNDVGADVTGLLSRRVLCVKAGVG